MKMHGLWRFHRDARNVRLRSNGMDLRWWDERCIDKVCGMIDVLYLGRGRSRGFTNAAAICMCASRFARRFGGVRTVEDWNNLTTRIAERAGFTHHATMREICINGHRDRSPIFFDEDVAFWIYPPHCKFTLYSITKRRESIKAKSIEIAKQKDEEESKRRYKLYRETLEVKEAVASINSAIKAAKAALKETA